MVVQVDGHDTNKAQHEEAKVVVVEGGVSGLQLNYNNEEQIIVVGDTHDHDGKEELVIEEEEEEEDVLPQEATQLPDSSSQQPSLLPDSPARSVFSYGGADSPCDSFISGDDNNNENEKEEEVTGMDDNDDIVGTEEKDVVVVGTNEKKKIIEEAAFTSRSDKMNAIRAVIEKETCTVLEGGEEDVQLGGNDRNNVQYEEEEDMEDLDLILQEQ